MEWLQNLSNKVKAVMIIVGAITFAGGGIGGFHYTYAKEAAFQGHIATHHKEDTKKRIRVLEEQMLEYREMFGKDLERATIKQKKRYMKWELEVEVLWTELEPKS